MLESPALQRCAAPNTSSTPEPKASQRKRVRDNAWSAWDPFQLTACAAQGFLWSHLVRVARAFLHTTSDALLHRLNYPFARCHRVFQCPYNLCTLKESHYLYLATSSLFETSCNVLLLTLPSYWKYSSTPKQCLHCQGCSLMYSGPVGYCKIQAAFWIR